MENNQFHYIADIKFLYTIIILFYLTELNCLSLYVHTNV